MLCCQNWFSFMFLLSSLHLFTRTPCSVLDGKLPAPSPSCGVPHGVCAVYLVPSGRVHMLKYVFPHCTRIPFQVYLVLHVLGHKGGLWELKFKCLFS